MVKAIIFGPSTTAIIPSDSLQSQTSCPYLGNMISIRHPCQWNSGALSSSDDMKKNYDPVLRFAFIFPNVGTYFPPEMDNDAYHQQIRELDLMMKPLYVKFGGMFRINRLWTTAQYNTSDFFP